MRALSEGAPGAPPPHRPVVAHVNYHFFHSTQSFIWFTLSSLRRTRPICLTRTPESRSIEQAVPAAFADDFYLYPGAGSGVVPAAAASVGRAARGGLTRLPPAVADPLLRGLFGSVVPRVRRDARPAHFLAWAEGILRARRAELIHAYFGPIGWRLLTLKERLGLPLVVTFLGDDVAPALGPWWSWWIRDGGGAADWPARLRELLARADLLLVEGPYLRDRVLELGGDPARVVVQRIALPLRELGPEGPARPARERTIVVFAGRFCAQKGVLYALEAVRLLREEGHDLELRLIGDETLTDGRYAASVYAFVRRHGLGDRVRFLGFRNHRECIAAMREADVFLHPSIVDDDGLSEGGAPTTIIEAQALGLPVVATWHCDIPSVTVPGESALLVPERDAAALAGALRELLDDPGRRRAMGLAGRRHVERFHDVERETPRLESQYLELLRGRG